MHLAKLINTENGIEVEFNVVPKDGAGGSVDASKNPVEQIKGAKTSVTDHISVNPKEINIDASLSNYDQILESYQTDAEGSNLGHDLGCISPWMRVSLPSRGDGKENSPRKADSGAAGWEGSGVLSAGLGAIASWRDARRDWRAW